MSHAPDRSRHLPEIRRPQAPGCRLGQRARIPSPSSAPSPTAASSRSARASSASRRSASTTCCATRAISPSPSSRPRPPGKPPATGCSRPRITPRCWPEVRLRDQRPRDHRVRLFHRAEKRSSRPTRPPPNCGRATAPAAGLADDTVAARLLTPFNHAVGKGERYYQEIAINRAVEGHPQRPAGACCSPWPPAPARPPSPSRSAGSSGTPAGTGPANTAGPRSSTSPTATSSSTSPRTASSPPSATPAARSKAARSVKSREMYFAIYQALAKDERRPGLYREYPPGLLRPDHRGRVPPRQRPRRQQLAGDSRIFRAGLSSSA